MSEQNNPITGSLDSGKGRLSVILGRGWMSRFEASGLAFGDVAIGDMQAGNPCTVRFNGQFFAEGEVVVLDPPDDRSGPAVFGVRLVSFCADHDRPVQPERGREATELLPFAIELAAADFSLAELAGTGAQTIILLGSPVDRPDDASLLIAGFPAGRGKVVVVGEYLGLRITALDARPDRGVGEVRTTGVRLLAAEAAGIAKDFDFRRPDCVTKVVIDRLSAIHQEFLRSLQMLFPRARSIRLGSSDQLTFGEWLEAKRGDPCTFRVLRMAGGTGHPQGEPAFEPPAKLCLCPAEGNSATLQAAMETNLRRHLSEGRAKADQGACFLSAPPAFESMMDSAEAREQVLSCLRNGWKRWEGVRFNETACHSPGWSEASLYRLCGQHDMILMAVFSLETEQGKEWMELIYPLATLRRQAPGLEA